MQAYRLGIRGGYTNVFQPDCNTLVLRQTLRLDDAEAVPPTCKMRLLHATELRFQEFSDESIPVYAILSHRWGDDEGSFQEMQYLLLSPQVRTRAVTPGLLSAETKMQGQGYRKVLDCCAYAAASGHKWVWIDTVCIDKASSAELSEAINSMWRWYKNSTVCYAYLSDVSPGGPSDQQTEFRQSEWFRRGWTLQELIAPFEVIFLDLKWNKVCTTFESPELISEITGIPPIYLLRYGNTAISECPIAMKMSWARMRKTSRKEDEAYCLMGLFSVNMPLLYGEGDRAFGRLCEEILKTSNDDSILLHYNRLLLPKSARDFSDLTHYDDLCYKRRDPESETGYVVTKNFLHVQNATIGAYPAIFTNLTRSQHPIRYIKLNCKNHNSQRARQAAITIIHEDIAPFKRWRKLYPCGLSEVSMPEIISDICDFDSMRDELGADLKEEKTSLYIELYPT